MTADAASTTTTTTTTSNKATTESNPNPSSATTTTTTSTPTTLKLSQAARKSFRKVTFRRAAAAESWGAVWLNARRPSIRAELKLNLDRLLRRYRAHLSGHRVFERHAFLGNFAEFTQRKYLEAA